MNSVGQTICLWRKKRGFTQHQLAESSRVSRPNLSAIEQGGRDLTVQTLRRIAKALEVNPGQLVDGIGPQLEATKLKHDRHTMDRIARWIAGKKVSISPQERVIASELKSVMSCKIGDVNKNSKSRHRKSKAADAMKLKAAIGSEIFTHLIQRVEKMLTTHWIIHEQETN